MASLWQDIAFSLRTLRNRPGFTAAAVVCLTLGIGATTGIFSVVNAVLLRPLPYVRPEQLVRIYSEFPTFPNGGLHRFWISAPEFLDLRRELRSCRTLDAWTSGGANLAGETEPVRLTSAYVSGTLMESLGVPPVMGRIISPQDDRPGTVVVADISYGVWKSVFGGDPGVVGRETLLNGRKCTIIGVMPRGYEFPPAELDPPQIWSALQIDPGSPGGRASHNLHVVGRLKEHVSAMQAQTELEALTRAWGERRSPNTHEFDPKYHTLVGFPMQAEVVAGVRLALLTLLGAVAFVLLIACVNVANLLLARAEARRKEIAIRGALGARTSRLARQFATEGILLSLCGAGLGLGLAYGCLRVVQITNAGAIPRAAEIGVDGRVLLFTLATSLLTGILFGMAPMLPLLTRDLSESLKDTSVSTSSGAGAQLFRRVLVAGELALALVLLIGCGLMMRAFWKLQEVQTGFSARNVVTMRVALQRSTYPDNAKIDSFWARLEERCVRLPGVQAAALVSGLPPMRPPNMNDTKIEGFVRKEGGPIENVDYYQSVSKDYFTTMGIRLLAGRYFDERDVRNSPDVVIINQTMSRTFWPSQDPLGRRIQPGSDDPWCTIVGVVEDVKNAGLDKPAGSELYLPYRQPQASGTRSMYVVLRAPASAGSAASGVRNELHQIDPALPLADVRLMEDVLSRAQARPRFLTLLLTIFSGVALLIATVGIYGVVSYTVERRTREIGVRMVLGARAGDLLGLVMKQGALMTLAGLAAGLVAAVALTQLMESLLFEVRPTDPSTFACVTLILAFAAFAATYVPALRATRVNPIQSLRCE
jgi:putative ABC transport system permease protein